MAFKKWKDMRFDFNPEPFDFDEIGYTEFVAYYPNWLELLVFKIQIFIYDLRN